MAQQKDERTIVTDPARAKQIAMHANHRLMANAPIPPGQLPPSGPPRASQPVGGLSMPGAYPVPGQTPENPVGSYPLPYNDARYQGAGEPIDLERPAAPQWAPTIQRTGTNEAMNQMMALRPIQQVLPGRGQPGMDLETPLPRAENPLISPEVQLQVSKTTPRHPMTGAPMNPYTPPSSSLQGPPEAFDHWQKPMVPIAYGQDFRVENQMEAQPIRRQAGVDDITKGRPPAGRRLA